MPFLILVLIGLGACTAYKPGTPSWISPEEVQGLLQDNRPHFQSCYQQELDSEKKPVTTQVEINFEIAPSGDTKNFFITNAYQFGPGFSECMERVVTSMQFPSSEKGHTAKVRQPLNFSTSEATRPNTFPSKSIKSSFGQ